MLPLIALISYVNSWSLYSKLIGFSCCFSEASEEIDCSPFEVAIWLGDKGFLISASDASVDCLTDLFLVM
jgi:hypothetical protein